MILQYVASLALLVFAALALSILVGRARFRALVTSEVARLFSEARGALGPDRLAARWDSLPEPVRRYLRYAILEGAPSLKTVRLRHDGFFRTKPDQRWFTVQGEEYFTVDTPGFVWHATLRLAPFVWVEARDHLLAGRGNMLVKFISTFPIADASGAQIDQGSHLRWLAEAVWFPYGFICEGIHWEPIDERSARATLLRDALPTSLVVEVDAEGKLVSVHGNRYRDVGGGSPVLTSWSGRCAEFHDFNGFRVPSFVEVAWDLRDGEFSYARFRVKTLEYNVAERF